MTAPVRSRSRIQIHEDKVKLRCMFSFLSPEAHGRGMEMTLIDREILFFLGAATGGPKKKWSLDHRSK